MVYPPAERAELTERQRRNSITPLLLEEFEWNLSPYATLLLAIRCGGAAVHWSDQNLLDKIYTVQKLKRVNLIWACLIYMRHIL